MSSNITLCVALKSICENIVATLFPTNAEPFLVGTTAFMAFLEQVSFLVTIMLHFYGTNLHLIRVCL